jgi:Tfp pilus assembly protein PilN
MAVPVLKLNLAPPSNYWRTHHALLSWSALALGALVLAGSLASTWLSYRQAAQSSRRAGSIAAQTRTAAASQARILEELRSVDVARELPRWRLAERIFTERSLPWSRLTAELERSLVQDVRLRSIQRTRGNDQKVQLKLKGEARSRQAEAEFVESLQKNAFFEQVLLERESERQGGGVDFDYTLTASSTPPPYHPLPKYGPRPKPGTVRAAVPQAATQAPRGVAGPVRTPAPAQPRLQMAPRPAYPGQPRPNQVAVPDPDPNPAPNRYHRRTPNFPEAPQPGQGRPGRPGSTPQEGAP